MLIYCIGVVEWLKDQQPLLHWLFLQFCSIVAAQTCIQYGKHLKT